MRLNPEEARSVSDEVVEPETISKEDEDELLVNENVNRLEFASNVEEHGQTLEPMMGRESFMQGAAGL